MAARGPARASSRRLHVAAAARRGLRAARARGRHVPLARPRARRALVAAMRVAHESVAAALAVDRTVSQLRKTPGLVSPAGLATADVETRIAPSLAALEQLLHALLHFGVVLRRDELAIN